MALDLNKVRSETQQRHFTIDERAINSESRTIEIAFSSEAPVERWFGCEILDHSPTSVDLTRLNNGGAVLVDHDRMTQIGVVEKAVIDSDRVGRATVRFGKSPRAEQEWQDVKDGIRRHISVGYVINEMVLESAKGDDETYRATKWQPVEVSFVSIPADPTVGVGRELPVITPIVEKELPMEPKPETPVIEQPAARVQEVVDIEKIKSGERKAEQARVQEILAIGDKFGKRDAAMAALNAGASVDDFRTQVLESMGQPKPVKVSENAADIGMGDKEVRQYSMLKLVRAMADQRDGKANAFKDCGLELEASAAVAKQVGRDAQGFFVPFDVARRDLVVGTATAGGHTVATNLLASNFITLLRNAMVVDGLGMQTLSGLTGNIAIPRQTGGATAYWVAESGSPTESQQAFDQVPMTPKTVGAFTDISRKLLLQSSIDVEGFVRGDIAKVLGLALQQAAINGSGASNQPTGILTTAGIGSVAGGPNGLAPIWDHLVDLETEVAMDNADIGSLGYLTNTKVRGKLKKTLRAAAAGSGYIWDGTEQPLNGYKAAVTNAVPSNLTKGSSSGVCSAIIFGNFADLIMGLWGGLDILVDPYTGGTAGTVRVVALQDVDFAVRHPESFSAMLDALTV